ncbi:MAG: DUF551 domain-containing protein [Smithella sp.]
MNNDDIPEEIQKMFPDQPIQKLDIDNNGKLHVLSSTDPSEPDFENMPIEQVNQFLQEHGYDPEQVGLRGEILINALIENIRLRERAEHAEAELAALKEERRWIPVSEKLPNDNKRVIFIDSEGEEYCGEYLSSMLPHSSVPQWVGYGNYPHGGWYGFVTHWMPMPEPPEGGEK